MTREQIAFENWIKEMESRFSRFQVEPHTSTQKEYWMHKNSVKYDHEIRRMRRFNNPCKACGLPLGTTHNFEVPEHGYVCGVCYAIYTSISGNRYMYNLHIEYLREKNVKK